MYQTDYIMDKARKLGLDTGNSSNSADNLRTIAEQVGFAHFNSIDDVDALEQKLDDMLKEKDEKDEKIDLNNKDFSDENVENSDVSNNEIRNEKFGQKEYDQAKNENGVYDKNHYKSKQNELDKKLEDAKHEKSLVNKKVGVDENGKNKYKNKNVVDKFNDRRNVAKARQDAITNKLNGAKASAYNMMHPGEALKDKAKSAATNAAKNAGKKAAQGVAKAGKAAGKAVGKAASAGIKALIKVIAANPIIAIIVVGAIFVILLIVLLLGQSGSGGGGGDTTSNLYSTACDAISISTTSLTKDEFVAKIDSYFSNTTSSNTQAFLDNAEYIYEIATSNNINPELVVVRAILEGFSPGGTTNNYWGIGCHNTDGSSCLSYDSFILGVAGFTAIAGKYDSVSSMMSEYAYIGDYWYNPGGSSVGGCYYYNYIKEYMTESRSNEVSSACSSDKSCSTTGEGDCLETNDEDQQAYAKWQTKRMAEVRETVFGISPDSCTYSGECVIYAQGDSRWGSIPLGNSNTNMAQSGCAVTSVAIGISCSGAELAVENFDAGVLINTLNDDVDNCFTPSGGIYWNCSAIRKIVPSLNLINHYDVSSYSNEQKNNLINSFSPNNHFIIVHFENDSHPRGHYVVYTETSGEYYVTKDPAGGKISNQLISEIDEMVVYSY